MKTNFIRYNGNVTSNRATEMLEIYFARKGGYLRYTFVHIVSDEIVADNWRIGIADFVSEDLSKAVQLTLNGEWECAVKLIGRDDFSGGLLHGDEMLDSVAFFVDGKETDIRTLDGDVSFDTLCITEATRLYDPKDHTTLIANHGKEYIFKNEKLVINQFVDWKISERLEAGYLAMFPISKESTSKFYTNRDYAPSDIYFTEIKGATTAVSYNDKFLGRFSVTKYPTTPENCLYILTDNGGCAYNKQYFQAGAHEDVYPGLRWESTTEYELTYNA